MKMFYKLSFWNINWHSVALSQIKRPEVADIKAYEMGEKWEKLFIKSYPDFSPLSKAFIDSKKNPEQFLFLWKY